MLVPGMQVRWYSFQFVLAQLVDELSDMHNAIVRTWVCLSDCCRSDDCFVLASFASVSIDAGVRSAVGWTAVSLSSLLYGCPGSAAGEVPAHSHGQAGERSDDARQHAARPLQLGLRLHAIACGGPAAGRPAAGQRLMHWQSWLCCAASRFILGMALSGQETLDE